MSIDLGGWLAGTGSIVQSSIPLRSQVNWARILDRPTDVQFRRNGVYLDPQTVRVELEDTFSEASSDLGIATLRKGTLYGVHAHPELDDTDVKKWDTFVFNDQEYTIVWINLLDDSIQADFEAVG